MKINKKITISILLFITLLCLPKIVSTIAERLSNKRYPPLSIKLNQNEKDLHQKLQIVDWHADSLLWDRDLTKEASNGHTDFPRMRKGNYSIQAFTIVTKVPMEMNIVKTKDENDIIKYLAMAQLWPVSTWSGLLARAIHQISKFKKMAEADPDFIWLKSRQDLSSFLQARVKNKNIIAGLVGLEGAHPLKGDLKNLDLLFKLGLRMVATTHFFDNDLSGSAHGVHKNGLTNLGREFVKKADQLGIIIDVAHVSEKATREIIKLSQRPVVVSHTGLRSNCNNQRNISDDLAKEIAKEGGLIAIGFWDTAICGKSALAIARAIVHAVKVVGENHVALGSDFDGAVQVPLTADELPILTHYLKELKLSDIQIHKVMGGNSIRFLMENLPPQ